MSHVIFRVAGMILPARAGERLLDLLDDQTGHGFPLGCRGANCAVCRVRVLEGESLLAQPLAAERAVLARHAAGPHERLACQLTVVAQLAGGESDVRLERV
jgi:ferredoxin